MQKTRIGIITGGGDAPGLNGVIEGVVRGLHENFEIVGICDGFEGIYENRHKPLMLSDVYAIHSQSGTILGTSNKSEIKGREKEFFQKYEALNLSGLIAVGGDGTFAALRLVSEQAGEIPLIGMPKTIDNDLHGTDVTFGYDTACTVVADSVDAIRATADAHRRVFVIEAMGRTAGWIALGGGLASLADAILIPEREYTRENLADFIKQKKSDGRRGLVIVAAEGAKFSGEKESVISGAEESLAYKKRFGGFAQVVSDWIEKEIKWESRFVILGHLQRSRPPSTYDRLLTVNMAAEACHLISEKKWGMAVVFRDGRVQSTAISEIMQGTRLIPKGHDGLTVAKELGIYI